MTKKLSLSSVFFLQIYSLLTIALYGGIFLKQCTEDKIPTFYLPIAFILIWQTLFIIFSVLLSHKYLKKICAVLLIGNAMVFYAMLAYHTQIDKVMLMNVAQTDRSEITELLNGQVFACLIGLGILPAICLTFCTVTVSPIRQILKSIALSLLCIGLLGGISYKSTDLFLHRFKYLQNYLPPINYLKSSAELAVHYLTPRPKLQKISEDIVPNSPKEKPDLIVFIMGETTRAANFSLNGYHRPTNEALTPYLNNIVYYPNTQACGTSTAIAVPCIFSVYDRQNFKEGSEVYTENILDIFTKADYKVRWLDNDGGCKDVCNRVYYEEPCEEKTCRDDILLKNLQQKLESVKNNQLIVLHTRGSHGPSYHLRYGEDCALYSPICTDNQLWNCTPEELVNVYDNTIHYVSKFIAQTIEILKTLQDKYNPVLIYTSDHGESLKEDGVFLHAAPYETAPKYQKEVPMLVWMPENNGYHFDINCLKQKAKENLHSHDNIFHSLLGLANIKSEHYQKELDIFANCKI